MRDGAEFFTQPALPAQRRYEAMRAYFVDDASAAEVADQRLRSQVPDQHTLPADTLPTVGALARFIHARGLTGDAVLTGLAEACQLDEAVRTPGELLVKLGGQNNPPVMIVDALDEAIGAPHDGATHAGGGEYLRADQILASLVRAPGRPRLRLLIGTRRHLLHSLTDGIKERVRVLDLDDPTYADPDSVRR
ncbi:MAG: hypothetical protein L0Y54_22180 [Sporichthyaceae bacterium]|nr:hypothetical protein [Sporichthyaceae bacterium]